MPRLFRPIRLLAAAAMLAGGLVAVQPASPAYAVESYPRPADGVFHFAGHGWGHGRGMSQYGAQGAASSGLSYTSILNFYYPNTAQAALAGSWMRVWLQAASPTSMTFNPAPGLAFRDVYTNNLFTLPAGPTYWRVTIDSYAMHVQGYTSAGWTSYWFGGHQNFVGPLRFGAGTTPLHLYFPDGTARDYDGSLTAVRASATTLKTVNTVTMEQYLYGVVPRESPSSWPAAALQAQSVAARSYSAYKRAHVAPESAYDICDSTSCQVYGGRTLYSGGSVIPLQPASTTAAVDATRGVVRTYGSAPIFAEFSASNGGYSVASPGVPYLTAHPDPYDGINNSVHSWTGQVSAAQLEARYPTLGRLDSLQVLSRDGHGEWGGRVLTVRLLGHNSTGAATSVDTTGSGIYAANQWPTSASGLRSIWWTVTDAAAPQVSGSLVGGSSSLVLPRNGTAAAYFDLRNTGTVAWPMNGALRVTTPAGSPSANSTWLSASRPGRLTANVSAPGATSVAPGQTGRFSLALAGNGRAAGTTARESFGFVWEAVATLPVTASISYVVRDDFTGTLAGQSTTVTVPATGTSPVFFNVRNSGNMPWPVRSAVRVGTSAASSPAYASNWLSPTRPAALAANLTRPGATTVAPGETGQFSFSLAGNNRPAGSYAETFRVVYEMVAWMPLSVPVSYRIG